MGEWWRRAYVRESKRVFVCLTLPGTNVSCLQCYPEAGFFAHAQTLSVGKPIQIRRSGLNLCAVTYGYAVRFRIES